MTIHRSQGQADTAHLFADGGGRELGYVGMSRGKASSIVHVVADDVGQAAEDPQLGLEPSVASAGHRHRHP